MESTSPQELVFVYGTLLHGEGNHRLLERTHRVGPGATEPRYQLVDLGGYPGLVAGGRTQVHGEVYRVDQTVLDRLDELEGHPGYYQRQRLRLADGRDVEAYVLPPEEAVGCPRIASGDWRRRDDAEAQGGEASAG